MMIQRWVVGRVRKLLALAGMTGMLGEAFHAALIFWSNSTRRNISTEQTAIVIKVVLLVPWTSRLMPTMVSFRPSTG
ncbi:hypothetical protein D3C85_1118830 [compost metagenome]